MKDTNELIESEFEEHNLVSVKTCKSCSREIYIAAEKCIDSLKNSGKILLFGNGGSAADAQHISAELVGRFEKERKGLASIALTTDTSALTSIGNDYSFNQIFDRQIEALSHPGDIAIGISTGGTSQNVISGLKTANSLGLVTIGFSGKSGGEFSEICDVDIKVPSYSTPRIQEMHITIGHILCKLIEREF